MQFKMAEGSLFAILLRSPWWYSALAAFAFVAISFLAFGPKYVAFGVAAALPLIGIACVAAYRQAQRPSQRDVQAVVESVRGQPARELTERLSAAYEQMGYEVAPYKGNGADIDLTRGWRRILVCSKRHKAARTGIEPLRALVQAGKSVEATGYAFVLLGDMTDTARRFATDNNIELIGPEQLTALLQGRVKLN